MLITELLSTLLQVQGIAGATSCIPSTPGGASACPASTFHAITAAFATQGYWVQADVLYYVNGSGLYSWAKLIYLLAAVSGIISMAMGFPPKLYLWFFMGPGVFHWLVQDTVPVLGVRWNIGPPSIADADRQTRAQREVWKLAETGIASTGIAQRKGTVSGIIDDIGSEGSFFSASLGKVEPAFLFVWFDALISDLVEWAIGWTGVFRLPSAESSVLADVATALPADILRTAQSIGALGTQDSDRSDDQHWLLTNLKWQVLIDIIGAKLNDADVRDAFATFLESECGEAFRRGIDKGRFVAASNAKGANVPNSVFARSVDDISFLSIGIEEEYALVTQYLATQSVPTPFSLRALLTDENHGGFVNSAPYLKTDEFKRLNLISTIRCDQYLWLLTHAFRWEAGEIYYQLISGLPAGVSPTTLLYTLFYGWPIRDFEEENFLDLSFLTGGFSPGSVVGTYTPEAQADFLTDLILIHLYRNEFAIAPPPYAARRSASNEAEFWLKSYQGHTGSKNKYGEVYTWALLIPYVQGVLMYLLAMAYPFICMLILVPGWHKVLFTWMAFWAWVKIWDIGWAIVSVLERSIWAIIGNRSDAVKLFSKVWSMQQYHTVDVNCPASALLFSAQPPFGTCAPGALPEVLVAKGASASGMVEWYNSLKVLDKAMTLGAAMDLDLANSYYIYIMSALYFAVPAVTAQLVLGAKAGAASLATQGISGTAQEAGRAVGQGHSSDLHNRALATSGATQQAAYARSLRTDPENFASNALGYGNQALMAEQQQSAASTRSSSLGQMSRIASYYPGSRRDAIAAGTSLLNALAYGANGGVQMASALGGAVFSGLREAVPDESPDSTSGDSGSGSSGNSDSSRGSRSGGSSRSSGSARSDLGPSAFNNIPPTVAQMTGAARAFAEYAINDQNRMIQAGYDARQAGEAVAGARYGFDRGGFREASGHQKSGAEFNAQMARYRAGVGLGNHAAAFVSAQGGQGGIFSPGSKPAGIDEMSITGQGGQNLFGLANFSNPANKSPSNSYFQWAYGFGSSLEAGYGERAAQERFGTAFVGEEFARTMGLFNGSWQAVTSAYAQSEGQSFAQRLSSVGVGLDATNPLYSPVGAEFVQPRRDESTGQPIMGSPVIMNTPPAERLLDRFSRMSSI
jgi:hypothetical protein